MSKPIEALAEEFLIQLENNEAFDKIIVKPYTAYADGALHKAKAEARKPAGERNLQTMADCLREHMIYNEIATLVTGQLAAVRQGRAAKEKAGQGGQKDLQAGEEPA